MIHRKNIGAVAVVFAVWALVAAWHPFYLGFFCDDWILFVFNIKYEYPRIIIARPGYAFALFCLKLVLSDSVFMWQLTSALLLLAAAYTVYLLTAALLSQFQYKQNEYQFGATIAATVYLIGPWSIVMGAWPTAAITLLSQIFVIVGLARLVSTHPKHPLGAVSGAATLLLIGFLIYESYWLLFAPVVVILWTANGWTFRDCLRFTGLVFGVLLIAILIKVGLSKAWGIPGKAISLNFLPMFLQNIKAYPRVIGDALQPISFKYLCGAVLAIVFFSLALGGSGYRRVGALFGSLFVGLASSALLYAVVGYGLAGTGVMSRTLAAQNVCFSLFVGISMMPTIARIRSLQGGGFRGFFLALPNRNIALPCLCCAFVILVFVLSIGAVKRSNEWSSLWSTEVSVLKQFPYKKLLDDLGSLEESQRTAVIVQIDADKGGEIFGWSWEIGPALVWMYPKLRGYAESGRLTFLVGRESELATVWDGNQVIQKLCGNNGAVVTITEANKVIYVGLSADGGFRYNQYIANRETGCRQGALPLH